MRALNVTIACAMLSTALAAPAATRLVGFASLPADTFADGPGAGAGIAANGRTGPFPGQPVQGFSAVQRAPEADGAFWFLSDNGFGSKSNSGDYLLRIYQLRLDFRTARGGTGTVVVEDFVQLADPKGHVPFPLHNQGSTERHLTGADFDIESFVIAPNGDIWIGEELGPFVLRFDADGRLLAPPMATPDLARGVRLDPTAQVRSPDNPYLAEPGDANLGRSGGFEGMAFGPNGTTLYPLLEKSVGGDPPDALRVYAFEVNRPGFSHLAGFYRKSVPDHAIGDFTPINNREFLVIERDNGQGDLAKFKKIFKIDITKVDQGGYIAKEEVVDLLDIEDPGDLNGDGKEGFTFPFITIENVLVLSQDTILVANDNNYPFSVGRGPDVDDTEIIVLRLDRKLRLDPHLGGK
jgi:glycerophosphoryl diester phosphodiesterase